MDASTGSLLHILLLPGISAGAPALQGEHRAARAAVNPSLQPRALPNSPFHPNLWKSRSLPATHSTIARWNRQCSPAAAGAPQPFSSSSSGCHPRRPGDRHIPAQTKQPQHSLPPPRRTPEPEPPGSTPNLGWEHETLRGQAQLSPNTPLCHPFPLVPLSAGWGVSTDVGGRGRRVQGGRRARS